MNLSYLILLPLFGFLINGVLYLRSTRNSKKVSAELSGGIATVAMLLSFAAALYNFFLLRQLPAEGQLFDQMLFPWFKLAGMSVDFTLRLDPLSSVFCLVITGVGSLIHLYSIGYMHHDAAPAKYFAYLNLFCFMMLNLVLGATMPHVFFGWEGVGLASYLLIGYWYHDPEKVGAGMKAFVMNRIGDIGFLVAMFIAYKFVGSLDFIQIANTPLNPEMTTTLGLLVFFACTGKSAQIPLFTWLPDAMAGPTPVSALIHAATMVTSGIYLLARMHTTIEASATTLSVIAAVGACTAFISAVIACAQTDIKKILAYSTVSQLGFMFVACGVGFTIAGVFHVMTHAFFKALMFLGAGSVIHALHEEQDVFKMGGLRKKLPITFWTFVAGWAAILGLPPFSGFFSKDEILIQSLQSPHGSMPLFLVMMAAAFLTAFYMTRLLVLVFLSPSRMGQGVEKSVHESPLVMTLPLMVLGVASVVGGWFGLPIHEAHVEEAAGSSGRFIMLASVALALVAAFIAYKKYGKTTKVEQVNDIAREGFKIDAFYLSFFGNGTKNVARWMGNLIEQQVIQRMIRWTVAIVDLSGNLLKVAQVGSSQAYLMMMFLAIFAVLAWFLFGVGQYAKF
ncbi:MAG: NADH-quinone oxidoreductase subunit L [Bdellovibrionales bacterium]|nr:NADH-quinone oxidoreductase subunit L [Bdellovibrionales bacterium]